MEMMKHISIILLVVLSGCNIGHPVKSEGLVDEKKLVGKYQYRDEFTIVLNKGGTGYQVFEGEHIPFEWNIQNNEVSFSGLRGRFDGKIKDYGKQNHVISNDYREYYYPFGSPYDFDNHEVWDKIEDKPIK